MPEHQGWAPCNVASYRVEAFLINSSTMTRQSLRRRAPRPEHLAIVDFPTKSRHLFLATLIFSYTREDSENYKSWKGLKKTKSHQSISTVIRNSVTTAQLLQHYLLSFPFLIRQFTRRDFSWTIVVGTEPYDSKLTLDRRKLFSKLFTRHWFPSLRRHGPDHNESQMLRQRLEINNNTRVSPL